MIASLGKDIFLNIETVTLLSILNLDDACLYDIKQRRNLEIIIFMWSVQTTEELKWEIV